MVCTPIAEVREPSLKSWVSSPTIPSSPPSSATTSLESVSHLTTTKKITAHTFKIPCRYKRLMQKEADTNQNILLRTV